MGSRGSSSGSGSKGAIASATKAANAAVESFIAKNGGMASDGELNGTYEEAFMNEAVKRGASMLEINNELNKALRTDNVDYVNNKINLITRELDSNISSAEKRKLEAEYTKLANLRSADSTRRLYERARNRK